MLLHTSAAEETTCELGAIFCVGFVSCEYEVVPETRTILAVVALVHRPTHGKETPCNGHKTPVITKH
jgi:hypothetical protein